MILVYRFPDKFEFMVRLGELFSEDMPRVLAYLKAKHGEPVIVKSEDRKAAA